MILKSITLYIIDVTLTNRETTTVKNNILPVKLSYQKLFKRLKLQASNTYISEQMKTIVHFWTIKTR